MYAKSLTIYGFKCFGKASLEFQYPGRKSKGTSEIQNVNVILGDNGGGKSSVLRALAIATLAPILLESGFVAHRLVRRPKPGQPPIDTALLKAKTLLSKLDRASKESKLPLGDLELLARLELRKSGNVDRLHLDSTPQSPLADILSDDQSPAFFIAGYGATRRVETSEFSESSARRSRGLRYGRVAGLFEDHVTLRPLQAWLPRIQAKAPNMAEQIVDQFNAVLPANVRFLGEQDEEGQYLFQFEGITTPLSSLSDGYKAFVGWIGDLLGYLAEVTPPKSRVNEIPGIVMVDEIDLHLHPQWQLNVVPTLAQAFPKIQFIFTSHSPLVANTVRRENIFVTSQAADGTATISQLEEFVYGRSIEQLLLSSYFGLTTTKPDSFTSDAQTLFLRAANGDAEAALDYVTRLSGPAIDSPSNTRPPQTSEK